MLTLATVEAFLSKVGYSEFNTSNISIDSTGDYLITIDPDADFQRFRKLILKNPVLNKKIVDQGLNFVEIVDTVYFNDLRAKISVLSSVGLGGSGVKIKMLVKIVEAPVKGQLKKFLGFGAYEEYRDLVQV